MRNHLKSMLLIITGALLCGAVQPAESPASVSVATIDAFSGKPCAHCHRSKMTPPFVHGALTGNKCIPCHKLTNGSHQSNHWLATVKERSARLCYECHDNWSSQKSIHQPVLDNDCLSCHVPHAAPEKNLLRFASRGLCFECHERTMVQETVTRKASGFRNGDQDLHYLHAGKSGIFCLTCHDVHASGQSHLLRSQGAGDKEKVTLTVTADGGSCTTSCHDVAGYTRK